MLFTILFPMLLTMLKEAFKSPQKKEQLRSKMVEAAALILLVFGSDPTFFTEVDETASKFSDQFKKA